MVLRHGDSTNPSECQAGWFSGHRWADEISANLEWFWACFCAAGLSRELLLTRLPEDEALLPAKVREEIRGLAAGSGQAYTELLAYNLYRASVICDC